MREYIYELSIRMKNRVTTGFFGVLTLFIAAGMIVPGLIIAQDFAGGAGTEADPYQIETWEHLNNVRDYLDSHFILNNDLTSETDGYDTYASSSANGGLGWDPIGDIDNPFEGVFNGGRHIISSFHFKNRFANNIGLFGYVIDAVLEEIYLSNISIEGNKNVGALIGVALDSEILETSSSGTVLGSDNVGGVIGSLSGKVTDSQSTATVCSILVGSKYTGGLIGYLELNSTVENSHTSGDVSSAGSYVGGFVGYNSGGNIYNSSATGEVHGNDGILGGFVAQQGEINSSENIGEIHNSFSSGLVYAPGDVFIG